MQNQNSGSLWGGNEGGWNKGEAETELWLMFKPNIWWWGCSLHYIILLYSLHILFYMYQIFKIDYKKTKRDRYKILENNNK